MTVDIAFDFRTDTPAGRDPDAYSATLRRYHRLLWCKPLPSGALFDLSESTPRVYLHHRSKLGEFWLSSDAIMPSFTSRLAKEPFASQLQDEAEAFDTIAYTIGARTVWPGNRIDGHMTINQARGFNGKIADRFDLTVECIRRHYLNQDSPLAPTLSLYGDFFALFGDFRGYLNFFLLDDLVHDDGCVKFFMPFDNFAPPGSAVPKDLATYREFFRRSIELVEARNHRIERWSASHQCPDS